jgi:hypothetical protein
MALQTRSKTDQRRNRTPSPSISRGEHDTPARVRVIQLREAGRTAAEIRETTGIPERS